MRIIKKNSTITVLGIRRNDTTLFTTIGRTIFIQKDQYVVSIPKAELRFWILKKINNKYKVILSIPYYVK